MPETIQHSPSRRSCGGKRRQMDDLQRARVERIEARLLDALARDLAIAAVALRDVLDGLFWPREVRWALEDLTRRGAVVQESHNRSVVYRLPQALERAS